MPPPKPKLYKNSGKSTPTIVTQNGQPEPSISALSPEAEQQFEIELCWCIQQLQLALNSGKLNSKQVQDHTKSLNTLMNNNAPIVKKRQVMRLSFGDYRAKMTADAKKSGNVTMKVKPATPSKNSLFVKKSSNNTFRFNFDVPQQSHDEVNGTKDQPNEENKKVNSTPQYVSSNNSFRFSFKVEEQES